MFFKSIASDKYFAGTCGHVRTTDDDLKIT